MPPANTPSTVTNGIHPRNWSISRKISVGFGGLILLMVVSMGITLFKLDHVKHTAASALEERQPAANYFQRLSQKLNQSIALINGYLLTGEPLRKAEFNRISAEIASQLEGAREQPLFQDLGLDATLSTSQALLQQFHEHAKKLFELHDNNQSNRGLLLAEERLNPAASRFLSNISSLLNNDDIDLDKPHIAQAVSTLRELRYNWVRMMWALGLYVVNQDQRHLTNFNNFNERVSFLLDKLNQTKVDIGFDEIEIMNEARSTYLAGLPAVLDMFETDTWRADTQLLRNKVYPITDQLQSLFGATADKLLDAAFDNAQELTHALNQVRISSISLMALALLTGILLAMNITRGVIPPIQRLMHAARQVAEGDLNAEVMITSSNEIGQLGKSFNAMTDHLRIAAMNEQQMLDDLQNLNQDLEGRVEERTKDLEKSEIKIRAILDNIGEGILVLNENDRIESINPAAEQIFAMKEHDAIGLNSALLIAEQNAAGLITTGKDSGEYCTLFSADSDQQPKEYLGLRANGSTFPMEFVVTAMHVGDKALRVCIVRDVTTRKETEATLADVQNQLVDAAHKSGMADMATGVLHNIGNILNSVNLASEEIHRISGHSKITSLLRANDLLSQHEDNMQEFLTQDARGKKLPEYFIKIGKVLNDEIKNIQKESTALIAKTTMMKEVISTQQAYAKSGFHSEQLNLPELVEDALKIQEASLRKWGVKLNTQYADTPLCAGQKSKLLQVITNLIKNAKEAMADNDQYNRPKELNIETGRVDDNSIFLKVQDNGCGINAEQLAEIFSHGFTTKETGHGFGLHTSANAMTEMKGSLKVDSEGLQKGACFTVTLPVSQASCASTRTPT